MSRADIKLPQVPRDIPRMGETSRKDAWWLPSLLTFLGLGAFVVYSTWAAFQGNHYWYGPTGTALLHNPGSVPHYLSPMYSPALFDMRGAANHTGHAWFGEAPKWLAALPFFSPALLILWAPGGFRFTCYYYRGAYYKAFWADPMSCAVGEPGVRGKKYRGEQKFPLILQNIHRYFVYLALLFLVFLAYDAVISYKFTDNGQTKFGVGIGSLILTVNPILLGGYTLGCHSIRHLIGGRKDSLASLGGKKKAYDCVSCLNRGHMKWAWFSLFWVGFTDVYVRLCSMGYIHDLRLI